MSEGQVDMSIGQERLTGVFQGIPAIYLLLFCQAVDQLGVDPDLITEGMELSDDQLLKPGARISMRQGYIAAQRGSALAGSLGLGMVYAKTLKPTLHGPVGLLAMTSESVGAALHALTRYLALRAPFFKCEVTETESEARFTLEPLLSMDAPIKTFLLESVLVAAASMIDSLVGNAAGDDSTDEALSAELSKFKVCFDLPKPDYFERFAREVSFELEYGAPVSQLVVPRALFERAPRLSDPDAAKLARQQCEIEYTELFPEHETLADQIARHLSHCQSGVALPDLSEVAKRFHLSPRTLRRRLSELDTGFSALTDQELLTRAQKLLRGSNLGVSEVAYELGYPSVSNFSASFKRLSGKTPKAYRDETE